ncbi:molybdopterin cofactor-binding domain-containing protein, partial [Staphylococcus aureus]
DIKVVDFVAVHDVGRVINPLNLEGQLEGGIHMGLGYALSEELAFDEQGRPKATDFKTYKLFRTVDMPKC